MNEELAYRTIAYLIGHYKTNDETTMNREEIAAINFILSENQQLKEKLDLSEKARKEAIKFINEDKNIELFTEASSYAKFVGTLRYILDLDIDKGK